MEIKFSTSGSAFISEYDEDAINDINKRTEVIRILNRIENQIQNGYDYGFIMDINGNKIGKWKI